MRIDRIAVLIGGTAALVLAGLVGMVAVFRQNWPTNPSEWASWVQAWGSIVAILAAVGAVWLGHRLEVQRATAEQAKQDRQDEKARKRAEAVLVLSVQSLAAELRRMNRMSGYQIDALGNQILYPDIAGEFIAVAEMLGHLPIERVAALGGLDDLLTLRRAALEVAMIYKVPPVAGEGVYLKNRDKLYPLEKRCGEIAQRLAERVEAMDPELYAQNKDAIEKR